MTPSDVLPYLVPEEECRCCHAGPGDCICPTECDDCTSDCPDCGYWFPECICASEADGEGDFDE